MNVAHNVASPDVSERTPQLKKCTATRCAAHSDTNAPFTMVKPFLGVSHAISTIF